MNHQEQLQAIENSWRVDALALAVATHVVRTSLEGSKRIPALEEAQQLFQRCNEELDLYLDVKSGVLVIDGA